MNDPLAWPEPAAVIMMVMFSFLGGAAVYRANVHVAVQALLNAVPSKVRRTMLWGVDACMAATALFMLGYGVHLCFITQYQSMAEFPGLSVAIVYAPIPVAGVLMALQGLAEVIRAIVTLRTGRHPRPPHDLHEPENKIPENAP